MNTILTKIETSQDAVNFLVKNATEENWNSIEESIIMAKFKADLNLEKELFDAFDWPLDREAYLKYLHKFERWTPLQSKNKVWNKKGAFKLAILFEYKDEQSFVACQKLLEKYHHPKVKNFINKVVGTRGIVLHEFTADEFS